MFRGFFFWIPIYLAGLLIVWPISLVTYLNHTDATDLLPYLGLPLVWTLGFWPVILPLVVIWKLPGIQHSFHRLYDSAQHGELAACELDQDEQVMYWTEVCAGENGLPRFLARPFARHAVHSACLRHVRVVQERETKKPTGSTEPTGD